MSRAVNSNIDPPLPPASTMPQAGTSELFAVSQSVTWTERHGGLRNSGKQLAPTRLPLPILTTSQPSESHNAVPFNNVPFLSIGPVQWVDDGLVAKSDVEDVALMVPSSPEFETDKNTGDAVVKANESGNKTEDPSLPQALSKVISLALPPPNLPFPARTHEAVAGSPVMKGNGSIDYAEASRLFIAPAAESIRQPSAVMIADTRNAGLGSFRSNPRSSRGWGDPSWVPGPSSIPPPLSSDEIDRRVKALSSFSASNHDPVSDYSFRGDFDLWHGPPEPPSLSEHWKFKMAESQPVQSPASVQPSLPHLPPLGRFRSLFIAFREQLPSSPMAGVVQLYDQDEGRAAKGQAPSAYSLANVLDSPSPWTGVPMLERAPDSRGLAEVVQKCMDASDLARHERRWNKRKAVYEAVKAEHESRKAVHEAEKPAKARRIQEWVESVDDES